MTSNEELQVAKKVIASVEKHLRERMDQCPYCDLGTNAYDRAEDAIRNALEDVRKLLR